jgi:hypothetical protein
MLQLPAKPLFWNEKGIIRPVMVQNIVIQTETGSAVNTSGGCLGNWNKKVCNDCLFITQTAQIYAF